MRRNDDLLIQFNLNVKKVQNERYKRWKKKLGIRVFHSIWHPLRRSVQGLFIYPLFTYF